MDKFQTKKSLGQNFLNSKVVPVWLVDAGEVKEGDVVVEVGPGTGALTRELLGRGAEVIALEADKRAIAVLEEEFKIEIAASLLKLQHTDVRKLNIGDLNLKDHSYKVVANIPYYLTGHLFRLFLESDAQPNTLVFLVQKEVGKRATDSITKGGKESLLSLSLQAFGKTEYVRQVGKGHFTPSPKVDSAIVKVGDINRDNFKNLRQEDFFAILHLGFGSKRKQLLGNLAKKYQREDLIYIFKEVELKEDVRAEDIPLKKWLELAMKLVLT